MCPVNTYQCSALGRSEGKPLGRHILAWLNLGCMARGRGSKKTAAATTSVVKVAVQGKPQVRQAL